MSDIKSIMIKANQLQRMYNRIGASRYQSIRNPQPMRKLVLTVLPKLPTPATKLEVTKEIKTTITSLGQSFVTHQTATNSAYDALGSEYYVNNALSVADVVAKLKAKGYIVTRCNVISALNLGKWNPKSKVHSMTFKGASQTGMRRRVSVSRYFVAA